MDLAAPLRGIRGFGPKRLAVLAAEGFRTVGDLLLHLPFRYEDRSRFFPIERLAPGMRVTVVGTVVSARLLRTRVRGFTIFRAEICDGTGRLTCVWFNQPYLARVLKVGGEASLTGEVLAPERRDGPLRVRNPEFEILGEDPEGIHTGRIVPIYRRVGDLSPRRLRGILHALLRDLPEEIPDPLPGSLARRFALPPRPVALREVHFPSSGTDPDLLARGQTPAHRRLACDELFSLQLGFARARRRRALRRAPACPVPDGLRDRLARLLPFDLTPAQRRAFDAIASDLTGPHPMRRLLQGDVGCGKTAVALLASLAVIEHGRQVALMAPTEVLAGQHEQRFRALLAGTRCRVGLLAASVRGAERSERIRRIARGEIDLVLGTHALLEAQVRFADLGLVIVDEQHRFGVRQRTRLAEKGMEPHFLLMTATPIPQSLALVLCGDLDVSVIDELPPGRAPVRTVLRSEEDRPRILAFLRSEVERGRRAIVVCSRVEDEEGRDARAAVSEARRLAAGPFAGLEVGLLHGRLAPEAKRAALEGFASGRTPVLVTTTVFEVGVDVPEATVILVERADRYGLAQLHQIRGRVGRGPIPSWCILVPGSDPTPEGAQRLRALTEISDGFEIATRDLQLRGPGEFRGLRQSGAPDLRVADPGRDLDLLLAAREEAERIVPPRIGSAGSQSRFLPQIR